MDLIIVIGCFLLIAHMLACWMNYIIYDTNLNHEIWLEIKKMVNKADIYDVSCIKYSRENCYVVIKEDGLNVPVKCSSDVYTTLKGMIELNNKDVEIKIKAKINRKDLSLSDVQGYLIK